MQVKNPQSSDGSKAGSSEPGASPWSPLQRAVFRSLWIALVVSNIGTWMQSVGAAWLMTSLTPSPLLVALMQTAVSLPVLLVGLPAGALADIVDRRKLLLVTVGWMLLVALALGLLTLADLMSAWTLLALTPEPEDRPVLITVEYRVPAERASDFIAAMEAMRSFRRREGAVRWDLFRDLADPERYLETFVVVSWGEHMRQHARVTVEDQAIEARAFAFLQAGVEPVAAHLIAARAYDRRTPPEPSHAELSSEG